MKAVFFSTILSAVIAATLLSCNSSGNNSNNNLDNDTAAVAEIHAVAEKDSTPVLPTEADTINKNVEKKKVQENIDNFSIAPIIKDYLALKNALVADNGKLAADAGRKLLGTLKRVDMKSVPSGKHKEFMDIAADAMENAEHIGDNAGKIAHQREHLASLSKDMNDLIAMFGVPQQLYQQHCPMYNEGKGAIWISEIKEIKNPYYGGEMLTCGSVKKKY
jgi:hypothetical protein